MKMKRRSKIRKTTFFRQFILASSLGLGFFLILFFLGLPFLARLSIFFERIGGREEIINTTDQTPPSAPQLESSFTATNSARITIQGNSESGSIVKLYINNQPSEEILVGKDGSFTKRVVLDKGENEITAQAIDSAGNKSSASSPLLVFYKKEAPLLEIDSPPDEDFETKEEEIEVTGETDPEANLNINNRFVFVKNDGFFNHSVSLSEGENIIKIVASDQAGNETKAERKVIYSPSD